MGLSTSLLGRQDSLKHILEILEKHSSIGVQTRWHFANMFNEPRVGLTHQFSLNSQSQPLYSGNQELLLPHSYYFL